MAESREDREAVLSAAIIEAKPGTKAVVFDDDDEHVYIGPVENAVERYRLGAEARRFLLGEFSSEAPPPELVLHAPGEESLK